MQQATLFETDDPVMARQPQPVMQQQPAQPTPRRFISLNEKMFAKGGAVAETSRLFQEGGMMQEGGTVDPVSGNEVPVGAMQEEVRDDIDAKLSEGEFVFPADVVRFIGLEKLMKMRDQAKQGLQRMDEMGQMGNADEVGATPNEMFEESDTFETDMDEIMNEVDSEESSFAVGGMSGYDLAKAPKNPSIDTRYFKHADGRVMYIVFINDKPSVQIPDGFEPMDGPVEQQVGKEAEEKAATTAATDYGGGPDTDMGGNYYQQKEDSLVAQGKTREEAKAIVFQEQSKRNAKINNLLTKFVKNSIPFKAVQFVADKIAIGTENAQMNKAASDIVSGDSPLSGSPFATMSEAQAVANFGYGSDEHFDAIDNSYSSLPSNLTAPTAPISSTSTVTWGGGTDVSVSSPDSGGGESDSGVGTGMDASNADAVGGWLNKGGLASKKKKKAAPKQTSNSLASRK